jgi:cyanophycin synthetase
MNKITELYYKSCVQCGLDPLWLDDQMAGFRISLGEKNIYFKCGYTIFNDIASTSISNNKYSTNQLLALAGIPVPMATAITFEEFEKNRYTLTESHFKDIPFPIVLKPTWNSSCGRHVVCNLKNKQDILEYLEKNIRRKKCITIEEYQPNLRSYRVLVFYDKVIGVVERTPAHVVGNSIDSIQTLIKQTNDTRKKLTKSIPAGPIRLNEETKMIFDERGITINTIPKEGEIIPLRYICNATFGGTLKSLDTNVICKENARLAVRAAHALGLNFVGFDVICKNIRLPIEKTTGYFIEANADPDITIHENCPTGIKNQVSKIMIEKLVQDYQLTHPWVYVKNHYFLKVFLKTAWTFLVFLGLFWGLHYYVL